MGTRAQADMKPGRLTFTPLETAEHPLVAAGEAAFEDGPEAVEAAIEDALTEPLDVEAALATQAEEEHRFYDEV